MVAELQHEVPDLSLRSPLPLKRRRKRGLVGDVAAIREQGQVGDSTRQYGWFRSLALYELGDVSYGSVTDETFMGQVRKLRDSLRLVPLTESARRALVGMRLVVEDEVGPMKHVEAYTVDDQNVGRVFEFANGEYVRYEQAGEFRAISWSCALPLVSVLDGVAGGLLQSRRFDAAELGVEERLSSALAAELENRDDPSISLEVSDGWIEGSYSDIYALALGAYDEVNFIRFDSKDFAFAWRSRVGRSTPQHMDLHECSVIARAGRLQVLPSLLVETATQGVGKHRREILWRIAALR